MTDKMAMDNLEKLIARPLPSTRNGAFFNTFPYPTKISPESIAVYIASFTNPGDTVLDTFGGSGSTGIAALLCEHPTDRMRGLADEMGVSPIWGKRNAVEYEIGTYASFAAETITGRLKADEFKAVANDFLAKEDVRLGQYYSAIDPDGKMGTIRHIIWSEILVCPKCGAQLSYFDEGTDRNPVRFKKEIVCPHCGQVSLVDDMPFQTEEYYDGILGRPCSRKKRVPAWVYGTTDGVNWDRPAVDGDVDCINNIESEMQTAGDTPRQIRWGELHRSGYHYGISYLHQFYTPRNYLVMSKLWSATKEYEPALCNALQLLLLSYNATHSTLMTRVVAKKTAKDFVLTGAQSGVLYVSKLPVEKNILLGLKRKIKPFYETYGMLEDCTGSFAVKNQSGRRLEESDGSVDFVFTDPPFGDFIPYSEVNQINELWLEKPTDKSEEIIISPSQNKGLWDYKEMLTDVFSEIGRVLKDNAYAAVAFHSAKAQVWTAFEKVIMDAGLKVETTSILDKKQASFKQVVSEASVQGDPLLFLKKGENEIVSDENEEEIIENVMASMKNDDVFDERRAYSMYVKECMWKDVSVSYDARDAYALFRRKRKDKLDAAV